MSWEKLAVEVDHAAHAADYLPNLRPFSMPPRCFRQRLFLLMLLY